MAKGPGYGNRNAAGPRQSKYLGARAPGLAAKVFGFQTLTPAGQKLFDKGLAKYPEVPRATSATPKGFTAFTGRDPYTGKKVR